MLVFRLISEGITDQKVLKNILRGYFDDRTQDKVRFINAQPERDVDDQNKQGSGGGWDQVFEHCKSKKFVDAMLFAELSEDKHFEIIQIDTDVSHDIGYNVPKPNPMDIPTYIDNIKQRLREEITEPIYQQYQDKIFFAICVNQLECWLLPLLYENDKKKMAATENCERKIEEAIKTKLLKTADVYRNLSNDYSKQKNLKRLYPTNPSFKIFIDSIENHFHQLATP